MSKMGVSKTLSKSLTRLAIAVAALGAVTVVAPTQARAQQQDDQTARKVLELIREARAAADNEDYETALQKYEQAFELYPDPAILVPMGRTAEKMGETEKAIAKYEEFIRLLPDDAATEKLRGRVAELRKTLPANVLLVSKPAGATIYLETEQGRQELGQTPTTVEIEPGEATIVATQTGYEEMSKTVTIEGGAEQDVSLVMTQLPTPAAEAGVSQTEAPPLDLYGYGALGVGVATLATSGVFLVLKESAEDDVNEFDKQTGTRAELQERKDDAEGYYDVAVYTGIAGGVLTAAGAGLLSYHFLTADEDDAVAWGVDAGFDAQSAWFGVNGSF